jgi:hypothetical protein
MAEFKPGDPVRHLVSREEGVIKSPQSFRLGNNTGECFLVTVGTLEKVWFPHEMELIDSTNRTSST